MQRYHAHARLADPQEVDVAITYSFDATSLQEAWNRWKDLMTPDMTFITIETPDGVEYNYLVLRQMFGDC